MSDGIKRSAAFSPCRTWRYTLERYWGHGPHLLLILLNPSTADETYDDPTNRRGQSFARAWGYKGVVFCNLFAYRTPYPKEMKAATDPVGPDNDGHIMRQADMAGQVVVAWGAHGGYRDRHAEVLDLLRNRNIDPKCFGLTKRGYPKHPLYLRADTKLKAMKL